jgi:threonylcarbamoyladenosine tRNA methylthiotransferase MtaB
MKTYAIQTLGCKVNQYESQQVRQVLEGSGLSEASAAQQPDLVVVNTCCVTHIASAKSRQLIRKAQKAAPDALVVVTGCLPAGQDNELKNLPDVLIVKEKNTLPAILDRFLRKSTPDLGTHVGSKPLTTGKIKDKNDSFTQINPLRSDKSAEKSMLGSVAHVLPPLDHFTGQNRAFLKVQDGCDAYCAYCIIPKIRKNVFYKDIKTVLDEARRLISAGHEELVLAGIFLGAYGQQTARRKKWNPAGRDALAELVDAVARLDGLRRLRLSSLEPLDVTDRLLEIMSAHTNIMPHLHLSLQSGSPNVLRKMVRQYRIDDFLRVTESIKAAFDRPAITTDIIVGFPGETEADFGQTVAVAKEAGFAKIHVFCFSPRKNTAAVKLAKLFGKVDTREIKRRASFLLEIDKQLQDKFRKSCIGLKESVLVEKRHPPKGRCARYFEVDLSDHPHAKSLRKGDIVEVTIGA